MNGTASINTLKSFVRFHPLEAVPLQVGENYTYLSNLRTERSDCTSIYIAKTGILHDNTSIENDHYRAYHLKG